MPSPAPPDRPCRCREDEDAENDLRDLLHRAEDEHRMQDGRERGDCRQDRMPDTECAQTHGPAHPRHSCGTERGPHRDGPPDAERRRRAKEEDVDRVGRTGDPKPPDMHEDRQDQRIADPRMGAPCRRFT